MTRHVVTFDLPEEVVALVGTTDIAAARARTSLLMDLLRDGVISQGQAARFLRVTRWDVIGLMAEHGVASGAESEEDVRIEIDDARRALRRP